ncbi:Sperm motility kinase Y [Tetrabaena socialis]|uniref:Sperm motility kinase Y n=1 Tax=Tetrabaena socialis TaxID=47790 RepID=A0A2J7ZMV0_9CHLO|nr:Sperm motility kinase Y [Tetrabaena socialis]|eukprot:PNH01588.1 Sperm motility kinase Y [Tetrabaena socialis]
MSQLLLGVHHIHSLGIIHRDINPRNILLDHAGTVRIADFGLAGRATPDMWLGDSPDRVVTENYRPPDMLIGASATDRSGHVSRDLVDLLHGLLQYDPTHRLTAAQALRHAWFRGEHALPSQLASACRTVIGRIEDPDAAFLDDARILMDIRHQLDRTVMEQLGEFHMALDQLDQTSGAQKDIYRMRFIMAMSRCIDRCNMPKLQAVAAMLRERAKPKARGWSDASNMIDGLDTMIRAMDMEKNRML